ncbi:DNA-binding proteins Bright/BRCAA1/RBP1 and proteins containing BRIGHT domain [Recurvomyces mirabilis]|nr:DNA-binding proteins Bright/BRCAA1/RBP1 and proteins containing BRIGHT domain [Recurvomyces mirabilis]
MALASPRPSIDVTDHCDAGNGKHGTAACDKLAGALLTPPNSLSPELSAHLAHVHGHSPPLMDIEQDMDTQSQTGHDHHTPGLDSPELMRTAGMPLSKGALSGLDASAAITPGMLAKHHLPGIMLGNGPRPIRYVMGELTQTVPGFSRIPPAKARRLVVAALESRNGGGVDGSVTFSKTGWGRWDAHVKGSSRDSGIGSYEGHPSPPRSERSSYAFSHNDSAVHMLGPHVPSAYRDQHSSSWASIREEDELDMDMDVLENEADKMSLDDDDDLSLDDSTEEEDTPASTSRIERRAPIPITTGPRKNYNAISAAYARRWSHSRSWSRRPSGFSERQLHSTSLPVAGRPSPAALNPKTATPEEQAAAAALLSMGSIFGDDEYTIKVPWIDTGGVPYTQHHDTTTITTTNTDTLTEHNLLTFQLLLIYRVPERGQLETAGHPHWKSSADFDDWD